MYFVLMVIANLLISAGGSLIVFFALTSKYRNQLEEILPIIEMQVEIIGSAYDGDTELVPMCLGEEFSLADKYGVFLRAERMLDSPNRINLSVHMDRNIEL